MNRAFTLDRTLAYEIETGQNTSLIETSMMTARPVRLPAGRT